MKLIKFLLITLYFAPSFAKAPVGKQYIIDSMSVSQKRIDIIPNKFFARRYLKEKRFFAEYENDINLKNLDQETLTAPFIMSVISIIWASGDTYYVKSIDKELAQSLKIIKQVYKLFFPKNKWEGRLIADNVVSHNLESTPDENQVGMTFSGGLDSVYSSLAFEGKDQILMTALGFSEEAEGCWQSVKDQVSEFATTYGNRKNFFVRSNFRSNLNGIRLKKRFRFHGRWREYFQESISLAGLALPILVANNCSKFYIPSSYSWRYEHPWGSHPFIDDNIKFKNISFENHTYDITRFGKIQFVADKVKNGLPAPQLHTCRHAEDNSACTTCMKGLQTASGLIVEGQDPKDYGYATDTQETILKCTEKMKQKSPYPDFDSAEAAEWNPIKDRIKTVLESQDISDSLKHYLTWILNYNFMKIVSNSQIYRYQIDFKKHLYFLNEQWKEKFLAQKIVSII